MRCLQDREEKRRPDLADEGNLAQQFCDAVFGSLGQQIAPHLLAQLLGDDGEYHRDASTRDRRRNLPLRNRGCDDDQKQIRFPHIRADRVKANWGRLLCGQIGRTNGAVDGAEGERVVRAAAVAGRKQLRAGIGDQSAGDVAGRDIRSRGDR